MSDRNSSSKSAINKMEYWGANLFPLFIYISIDVGESWCQVTYPVGAYDSYLFSSIYLSGYLYVCRV